MIQRKLHSSCHERLLARERVQTESIPCIRCFSSFTTSEEEAQYYRSLSKDLQDELEDLKLALSEFQSSSKELEDEMEKELVNSERRESELRLEAERLRGDLDIWKVIKQAHLPLSADPCSTGVLYSHCRAGIKIH